MKEELIDDSELGTSSSPAHLTTNPNVFDNPIYDDEVKVDLGSEMVKMPQVDDVPTAAPVEGVMYDSPILYPPDDVDEKKPPKLNEYERL